MRWSLITPWLAALLVLAPQAAWASSLSNYGNFTETVPLGMPGPADMAPELSITLSSAGGTGDAGVGASLNWSSISFDTSREGVPKYKVPSQDLCDGSWDRLLSLDGMELVASPNDPALPPGTCAFRTQPDTFVMALPFWSNDPATPADNVAWARDDQPAGWAVVRRDGRVFWYGNDPGDSADTHRRAATNFVPDAEEVVSEWRLHHVEDRHGNLVTWHAENVFEEIPDFAPEWSRELRLGAISWAERQDVRADSEQGGTYAFNPSGDSIGGFELFGNERPPTWFEEFELFADNPADYFPQDQEHYYAVEIQWEERSDKKLSFRAAERQAHHHRIQQIAVAADATVAAVDSEVEVVSSEFLWSWLLQYDAGTTGKSRLRRIFRNVGYDSLAGYPALPADGFEEWTTVDSPQILSNPWEFFYSDDTTLADGTLPGPGAATMLVPAGGPTWLDESWQEGMPLKISQDVDGNGVPDIVGHQMDSPVFPNLEGSLTLALAPWVDLTTAITSEPNLVVQYAEPGVGWSEPQVAAEDPFALYGTGELFPQIFCASTGQWEFPSDCMEIEGGPAWAPLLSALDLMNQEDLSDADFEVPFFSPDDVFDALDAADVLAGMNIDYGESAFCTALGSGAFHHYPQGAGLFNYPTGQPTVIGGVPPVLPWGHVTVPTNLESAAAWCEYLSCAPYCEATTAVTHPLNPNHLAWPPTQNPVVPTPVPVGPLPLDIEDRKEAIPGAIHDETELLLWERYALTRVNGASDIPSLLPEHSNNLLGGGQIPLDVGGVGNGVNQEPMTKIRHVDGYARTSHSTRLHDALVEGYRNETDGDGASFPDSGIRVETGLVHDWIDLNGDGYADRVLSGPAALENGLIPADPSIQNPGAYVPNSDPGASKGVAISTELMPMVWAPFNPDTGEFDPPEILGLDYGQAGLIDDHTAPFDADHPSWFNHDHPGWLGLWESTSGKSGSPVSGGGGVSVGPSGVSASVGASLGPASVSFGATSNGSWGPSMGLGPVSISPTGLSFGPTTYNFQSNSFQTTAASVAAFVVIKVITAVLDGFSIPYHGGIDPSPDGLALSIPGAGADCLVGCVEDARAQRQGFYDMNGDSCPDMVYAGHEWPDNWQVAINNCDGSFQPLVAWRNSQTDYLELSVTDVFHPTDDQNVNAAIWNRHAEVMFALRDMNGDGLPDQVFYDHLNPTGEVPDPPYYAFNDDNEPAIDPGSTPSVGWNLWVKYNNGEGFENAVAMWPIDVSLPLSHTANVITGPASFGPMLGAAPAISSTHLLVETSELYNNGGNYERAGLLDWNNDGLLDYYIMSPPAGGSAAAFDLVPVIWFNTGDGFSTDASDPNYPSPLTLETAAMSGQQIAHWGDWSLGAHMVRPLPKVGVELTIPNPSGSAPISAGSINQSFFGDWTGDGKQDWVFTPDNTAALAVPLQSAVPDLLTTVRRPGGEATAIEYAPSRDFMDHRTAAGPQLAWDPGTEYEAFPARSQVVVRTERHDGIGGAPIVDLFDYDEPRYDLEDETSLGFGQVARVRGDEQYVVDYFTDRMRAGIAHHEQIVDGITVRRETTTTWSDAEFADNYVGADNWHFGPILVEEVEREPTTPGTPQAATNLATEMTRSTWTSWDAPHGMPACVQDDIDGDGTIDRGEIVSYDLGLFESGMPGQVAINTVVHPGAPYGLSPGMSTETAPEMEPWVCFREDEGEDGFPGVLPFNPQASVETEYSPEGRPTRVITTDLTMLPGPTPSRVMEYRWTPNGLMFSSASRSASPMDTIADWTLYDPTVGLYPVEQYAPYADPPSGPIEFQTSSSVCGITDSTCEPGAHGQRSRVLHPNGQEVLTEYDALGRAIDVSDAYANSTLDHVQHEFERFVRGAPADDASAQGLPAVARTFRPIGNDLAPAQATDVTFFDGRGRARMTRTDWRDELGNPGQKVGDVVEFDDRDRMVFSSQPCFSGATVLSQFDLDPSDPLQCVGGFPQGNEYEYDVLNRQTLHRRADGSEVRSSHFFRGLPQAGLGTVEELVDATGVTIQRTETVAGPFLTDTWRFGAETFRWMDAGDQIPSALQPDLDVLQTRAATDPAGHIVGTWRTGQMEGVDDTEITWSGFGQVVEVDDPDRGWWVFEHDDLGRVVYKEARHRLSGAPETWIEYGYDRLGRPTQEVTDRNGLHFLGTERWEWRYDVEIGAVGALGNDPLNALGQVSQALHKSLDGGSMVQDTLQQWSYDARGRIVQARQDVTPDGWAPFGGPGLLHTNFEYFQDDVVWSTHMPQSSDPFYDLGGEIVSVERGPEGQPTALSGFDDYLTSATYDIYGRPARLQMGNGTEQVFQYAMGLSGNQAVSNTVLTGPGGTLLDRDYAWSAAGDLLHWRDRAPAWMDPVGQPHGRPESVDCRYDGISALQECIGGNGYQVPPPGHFEPAPDNLGPFHAKEQDGGEPGDHGDHGEPGDPGDMDGADEPVVWFLLDRPTAIASDAAAPLREIANPFPLVPVFDALRPAMERGLFGAELAEQLREHEPTLALVELMAMQKEAYSLLQGPPAQGLQVLLEAFAQAGMKLPSLEQREDGRTLAAQLGLEVPTDEEAHEPRDSEAMHATLGDDVEIVIIGPKPRDWDVRYQYDLLGNLIRENVRYPGQVRDGRQFSPMDRTWLAAAGSGELTPINAVSARAQVLNGTPDKVFSQGFDARGNTVSQAWTSWPTVPVAMSEDGVISSTPVEASRGFTWNGRGRLKTVGMGYGNQTAQHAEFWYDDQGQTIGKRQWDASLGDWIEVRKMGGFFEWTDRAGGQDATFKYRLGGRLIAQRDKTMTMMLPDGYGPDGMRVRYVGGDHLGSSSVVTDEDGNLAAATRYEPYGRIRETWGPEAGLADLSPGKVEELFNGKQREVGALGHAGTPYEFEAYDYGARYYFPTLSKFASADPVTPDAVWEANAYSYTRDNPLSYRDPTGNYVEAGIEIVSLGMDLFEIGSAIKDGRWGDVAINTGILVVDGVLAVVPIAPGTVGLAVHGAKAGSKAVDAGKGAKKGDGLFGLWGKDKTPDTPTADLSTPKAPDPPANKSTGGSKCEGQNCGIDGSCFVAGTLVETKDGLVPIEEVEAGDVVLSRSDIDGTIDWRPVLRTKVTLDQRILEVQIVDADGVTELLGVTEEHPFWVRGERWVEARDLEPGDEVFSSAGGWMKVGGATWTSRREAVFNFEVGGFHTYFVGELGTWVHNSNCTEAGGQSSEASAGFGSGRGQHRAEAVHERDGVELSRGDYTSGDMTPEEAALGFPQSSLATHTERRILADTPLEAGDKLTIHGEYPPCPTCKGAMNKAGRESGADIEYRWGDSSWSAKKD